MATKSNSTLVGVGSGASGSNASYFEAPEIEYPTGTPSDATKAPKGTITRRFTLRGWDDKSPSWEFVGDDGRSFVSLAEGKNWFPDKDWENIDHEDKDMVFNGWYYKDQPVGEKTEIYSGSTAEERDDGIRLVASWKNTKVKVEENEYFDDHAITDVEGLAENQELVVKPVGGPYENWENDQGEMWALITDVLQQNLADLDLNPDGKAGTDFIGIDIDVTNYVADGNNHITITLMAPEGFINNPNEEVYAVHFKSDGSTEVIPVAISERRESDRLNMTFTVTNGFSPFFFVKVSKPTIPDEVTVKIRNVENGFVGAQTKTATGEWKYLPIGEEVTIKAEDQPIYFDPVGYEFDNTDWFGKCTKLEKVFSEEGKDPVVIASWKDDEPDDGAAYYITEDCEIVATFEQKDKESWHRDFYLELEPYFVSQENQDYTGTIVSLEKYNKETGKRETVPNSEWSVRPADAEELNEKGFDGYAENLDMFDFDAETKTLTSKQPLKLRYYWYPVVITYQGEEYKYYTDRRGENDAYTVMIQVGAYAEFYHSFVKLGDKYDSQTAGYLGGKQVSYADALTWGLAQPNESALDGGKPQMYNYEFVGWQSVSGVKYEADDQVVESLYEDEGYFEIFDMFVKTEEDGTVSKYEPEALGYDDGKTPKPTPTPGDGHRPGGGTGGSGGGSGSSTKDYSMHGSWIADGNNWKFRKDSGEYATNTWGFINGKWYYFDANGNMVTGWVQVNGQWYYLDPTPGANQGVMLTGWLLDPTYNGWFYLSASGAMVSDWQQINGTWYYLNPVSDGTKGLMAANTTIDGYYVNADGAWVQ